jgi:hypothetical protein
MIVLCFLFLICEARINDSLVLMQELKAVTVVTNLGSKSCVGITPHTWNPSDLICQYSWFTVFD